MIRSIARAPQKVVGGDLSLVGSNDLLVLPMVRERTVLRMVVPGFQLDYDCPVHGTTEATTMGHAVLDTGSPWTTLPRRALPSKHVTWDDLPANDSELRFLHGRQEYRWWEVRVSVLGIEIGTRVKVHDGELPDMPIVGVEDFGRQFTFAADFAADPPRWAIQRRGAAGLSIGIPTDEPFDFDDLVLLRYIDQAFVVPQPNTLPKLEDAPIGAPERIAFTAVMVDIDSPSDVPRVFIDDAPPAALNREQRRRLAAGH